MRTGKAPGEKRNVCVVCCLTALWVGAWDFLSTCGTCPEYWESGFDFLTEGKDETFLHFLKGITWFL